MKNERTHTTNTRHARKLWLLAGLMAGALALTGCYMEPDRIVDDNNGLAVATGGQTFDTVITPEPVVTATPEATATPDNQVDFANWDFGNTAATNPPSNVIDVGGSPTTTVTVGLSTPTPTSSARSAPSSARRRTIC